MKHPHCNNFGIVVLAFSIIASLSLTAVTLLNCAGVFVASYLGFLGDVAVQLGFLAMFVVAAAVSIRAAAKRQRFDTAYVAFAIELVTFTVLWSGILQRRVESWNFHFRLPRRAEVVELIRRGELQPRLRGPCECFYADLPDEYGDLSAGQEVLVSRHSGGFSVIFFVDRALMWSDDDYSAFVFRSDGNPPRTGDEDTDRFFEVQPVRQHWFFVRHT